MKKGHFKYKINNSKLDISNPIYCYFIGIVSTDGYIDNKNSRICIRMRNKDTERVFNLLKDYLEYTGPIFTYKQVDKELRISSLELIENLTQLGLNVEKHKIPFLKFKSELCTKMYIRGLHDGDGNIKRSYKKEKWVGGEFRYTNNNLNFQTSFYNWFKIKYPNLKTLNLKEVPRKSGIFYELSTGVQEGKIFASWFYSGKEEYKLNCKYNKYLSILR